MGYGAVDKGYHWVMTLAGAQEALNLVAARGMIERADLQARVDVSPMQVVKVLDSMTELQILKRHRLHEHDPWVYSPGATWDKFYTLHKQFQAMQLQLRKNTLQMRVGDNPIPIRRRSGHQ